jgi:hypothetical protein
MYIEDFNICKNIQKEIDELCKKWFEKNGEDWQHYSNWHFLTNEDAILITYWYEDFWSNTEMYTEVGTIKVTYNELLNFQNYENNEIKQGTTV